MEGTTGDKQPGGRKNTVEASLKKLEAVLEKLEDRGTPLERSFSLYAQGMELVKDINAKIDKVEKQMLILEGEDHE